jgi:AraC family transcriptional regulator of adaptative response / DNA-3-methyladenine glycosylase II
MTTTRSLRRPAAPIVIDVLPPFDAAAAFRFLRARAVAGAEGFSGETYLRATSLEGKTGVLAISAPSASAKTPDALVLEIPSSLARARDAVPVLVARVRRMFDADADPRLIHAHLARDPFLRKSIVRRPAQRVMGAFDPFEWAARAVLGQQVSVRAAQTIAGRLVARFGEPLGARAVDEVTHVWPDAARLAEANEERLAAIGLTRARARTLLGLARAVADGTVVLDRSAGEATTRESLLALPGIGPWTADYIAMRSLGWPDAFPAGDLGLRKALGNVSAVDCERRSQRWRPWRAYAAAHLWIGMADQAE